MRKVTRREFTRIAGLATSGLGATVVHPDWVLPAGEQQGPPTPSSQPQANPNLYSELLKSWCDGLMSLQIVNVRNPHHGGILCPACGMIHGCCGNALYPFLRTARTTGDSKYIQAGLLVHDWMERIESRPDGSWLEEVDKSPWRGGTVFQAIALAQALLHHGSLVDASTRRRWTERLARAVKWLDGFMNIETGNINYPVTSAFCFAICGQVLEDSHYLDRARQMAHMALEYFTPNNILFGEGHPIKAVTPKGCRPVDLGYNVEESLPSLALYALVTNDKQVLDRVISSMRTHMEFMLPDGAWDNSWGTRNFKWSWWGSRTSDGCQPAYELLANHDPRFREVARRNLQLLAECTHNGLLYGGPHYFAHGDLPCVQHTYEHTKALATVLDRAADALQPTERVSLPREEAYGLKSYPEIGTRLVAIGGWRATVTEYDWGYSAFGVPGGGHATGGALTVLYHCTLGPLLVASITQEEIVELCNQQAHRDYPHMTLTARVECVADGRVYTSLSDFDAVVTASATPQQITIGAQGRLLTAAHQTCFEHDVRYNLVYRLTESKVEIVASTDTTGPAPTRYVLPIVSPQGEAAERVDTKTVRVKKRGGNLLVRTDAPQGFESQSNERTFNLIPGFECLPLQITMLPGREIRVELSVESG
jgi:hypothetical protein